MPDATTPYRALLARHGELVDRAFLGTITPEEAVEMGQLTAQLDIAEAVVYGPIIARLQQALDALRGEKTP